jgi:hypothetical protein
VGIQHLTKEDLVERRSQHVIMYVPFTVLRLHFSIYNILEVHTIHTFGRPLLSHKHSIYEKGL